MAGDRDELSAALRSVADAMLARERVHPSAEELVRHSRGELLEADQERIQDHFAICPACARLRLALPQLRVGERAPANPGPSAAEDFERLRCALSAEAKPRPDPQYGIRQARAEQRWPWRRFAVAAALLVAIGLGWMLAKINKTTRELRPAINLPVAVLPLDPDRQATETLLVPTDAELLMVVIPLPDAADHGVYRIRLHGEPPFSWTSPPVEPRHGEITLTFATRDLRPGLYDLTVDQLLEAGSRRIGERNLRIRRGDGGR